MLGVLGVTAMDLRVTAAAGTVRPVLAVTPLRAAVMVDVPAPAAVARPAALIVATAVSELLHVTVEVMLPVLPSL
jgi:hypothetical protein